MSNRIRIIAISFLALALGVLIGLLMFRPKAPEPVVVLPAPMVPTPVLEDTRVGDSLRAGQQKLDSLSREIEIAHRAIRASRHEIQTLLDSALSANRQLLAELDDCRKGHLVCDSLRTRLTNEETRNRDLQAALSEARGAKDLLTSAQRDLTRLQALHTLRALFVFDTYVSSPAGQSDKVLDHATAKKQVVKYFDVCAVAIGWKERYCDIGGIVRGIENTEQFSAIRKAEQKHGFTLESLYFLSKLEGADPKNIDRMALRDASLRSLSLFDREVSLGFKGFADGLQTPGFEVFVETKLNALAAPNSW